MLARAVGHPVRVKEKPWLSNGVIAGLLAVLALSLLLLTAPQTGLTWDEPSYIESADVYVSWIGELAKNPVYAFSDAGIQAYWKINHEHPLFDKVWSGVIAHMTGNLLDHLTAHRLGNMILAGLVVAVLFLALADVYGRAAGLAACASLLSMPRFFFHAHLAALDVPTADTIFLVAFLFWRTVDRRGLKWGVLLGAAFGVAMGIKIDAFVIIPVLLGAWALLFRRRGYVFARLVVMGFVGLVVWVITWPWFYHHTWDRLLEYFNFMTVHHYPIEQYYRGRWLSPPPWHFAFTITLMVVPLAITLFAGLGTLRVTAGWRKQELGWLFVFGALLPILIFASGVPQVYDNDRLLMPSFPFIAALAGIGFSQAAAGIGRLLSKGKRERLAKYAAPLLSTAFIPHILVAASLFPHLLSYYSETVGGLPGAERLKMETTYWAETYQAALPYLNQYAPPGASVWVEANDVMLYYQKHGLLRSDLRMVGDKGQITIVQGMTGYQMAVDKADFVIIEARQSGFTNEVLALRKSNTPVYRQDYRGIPLLEIYRHSGPAGQ